MYLSWTFYSTEMLKFYACKVNDNYSIFSNITLFSNNLKVNYEKNIESL